MPGQGLWGHGAAGALVILCAITVASSAVRGEPTGDVVRTDWNGSGWPNNSGCGTISNETRRQWSALVANFSSIAPSPTSRCRTAHFPVFGDAVYCPYQTVKVSDGLVDRSVHYILPEGQAPASGWPVVLHFQGSFFTADLTFSAAQAFPFGAYYQTMTVKALLDEGYAVLAPNAFLGGLTFWDTNIPPWDTIIPLGQWPTAPDAHLLDNIFAEIERGTFGPLDIDHMHATGISSGAYMTSRVGFAYPGKFRSIAIESGSFYYCGGPACVAPLSIPKKHPPTLFLHGVLDPIVPIWTMELYASDLELNGIPHKQETMLLGLHQWIEQAPTAVPAWFNKYNNYPSLPPAESEQVGGQDDGPQPVQLVNAHACLNFSVQNHATGYALTAIRAVSGSWEFGPNLLVDGAGTQTQHPLWELTLVWPAPSPSTTVRSDTPPAGTTVSSSQPAEGQAVLSWTGIPLVAPGSKSTARSTAASTADVHVTVSLPAGSSVASLSFNVSHSDPSAEVSIWQVTLAVPGISVTGGEGGQVGTAVLPAGFGMEFPEPLSTVPANGLVGGYPSSRATMQWMAAGRERAGAAPGVYVATHDPNAASKSLFVVPTSGTQEVEARGPSEIEFAFEGRAAPPQQATPVPAAMRPGRLSGPDSDPYVTLGIVYLPSGAGLPWSSMEIPFDFNVGVVGGAAAAANPDESPTPLWYAGAMEYRSWALPSASWTKAGPIATRDDMPSWWLENGAWVNSGWQCKDIFNVSQGDPAVVREIVGDISDRFNLSSLAHHHYEWQQGPDPARSARYRFDTHYPDYDPARPGMADTVTALAAKGVKTFPYINGRIFDINSTSYISDDGEDYCVQTAQPQFGANNLSFPIETYGSGASFHVAVPGSQYWRSKYADTIDYLTKQCGVAGVYLDQLAAGGPVLDWTPGEKNGHPPPGGGSWWAEGVRSFIQSAKAAGKAASKGTAVPMVTESNAEPYMGDIDGYLTLVAFDPPFAQPPDGGSPNYELATAFPVIYGGLYMGFGDIYSQGDFQPNPDVLAARMAVTFVSGTQIGWFSLGGVDHGPDVDPVCGPMGTYDLWMSEEHDAEVEYLRSLVAMRGHLLGYLRDGHMVKPVVLSPPAPSFVYKGKLPLRNRGPFPSVASAVWRSDAAEGSVAVVIAGTTSVAYSQSFTLQAADYGFAADGSFTATLVAADGTRTHVGNFNGPAIGPVAVNVAARGVTAVIIAPASG